MGDELSLNYLIAGNLDIKSVRKNYKPITDSIMTGRSCSINGHYYSIGPKDLTDESSWLPYKNYKRNYNVKYLSFNSKGELSGTYESITEASRATGIPRLKISNCCEFGDTVSKKKNADYTFWCFNESGIDNILRSRIHKYSANGLLINTYKNVSSAKSDTTSSYFRIQRSIMAGNICSDGCYYCNGPKEFKLFKEK